MRVLVTGGAGFIGSHAVRSLVGMGAEVHVAVRATTSLSRIDDLLGNVRLWTCDLADPKQLNEVVRGAAPEAALHLAWYADASLYLNAVSDNLVSLATSLRLLEQLRDAGCPRVVLGGTCLENIGQRPLSIYAAAKLGLHQVADRLVAEGDSIACAHIFYLYGPWEDERRLVPSLISALLRREPIAVTDGKQQREYLHVTDVGSALGAILTSDLVGRVDVCSGHPIRVGDIFEAIERELGGAGLIHRGERPYSSDEVVLAAGDPVALSSTGWRPAIELAEGIHRTVEWWREHSSGRTRPPRKGR